MMAAAAFFRQNGKNAQQRLGKKRTIILNTHIIQAARINFDENLIGLGERLGSLNTILPMRKANAHDTVPHFPLAHGRSHSHNLSSTV